MRTGWDMNDFEIRPVLAALPLFAETLGPRDLDHLAAQCRVDYFPAGAFLMTEGDFADAMFALVEGEVQVTFHDRYTLPVNFQPGGEGVWLPADRTTQVRVPTAVPVDLALRISREAYTGSVPYHVVGKADVTATRSLKIESDDYSVDEKGALQRHVIEQSIAAVGIPLLR